MVVLELLFNAQAQFLPRYSHCKVCQYCTSSPILQKKIELFAFWRALRPDGRGRRTREACPICPLQPGIFRHFRHRVRRESGDEDVFPVVVEVGEMAGGGGVAEVEIPVEVQEGAVIGVQGGGED